MGYLCLLPASCLPTSFSRNSFQTYARKDPQVSEQIFFFQNHVLLEQTDLLQTSLCHPDSTRLFCSGPAVYFNEQKTFSQEFTTSHSLMPGSQVLKSIKKKKKKSLPHNPPGTFQPSTKIIPENCPYQAPHQSAREPACGTAASPQSLAVFTSSLLPGPCTTFSILLPL